MDDFLGISFRMAALDIILAAKPTIIDTPNKTL